MKIAPDFELWKREQFAASVKKKNGVDPYGLSFIQGDFNGDGRPDAAVFGHGKDNEYLVAILSTSSGSYAAQLLDPPRSIASRNTAEYLQLEPRGVIDIPDSVGAGLVKFRLVYDGISQMFDDEASMLFYWAHGGFKQVSSGD